MAAGSLVPSTLAHKRYQRAQRSGVRLVQGVMHEAALACGPLTRGGNRRAAYPSEAMMSMRLYHHNAFGCICGTIAVSPP